MIKSIQQIFNMYHGCGSITMYKIHMELQGINLNILGREKHVPEIKRLICTVKG